MKQFKPGYVPEEFERGRKLHIISRFYNDGDDVLVALVQDIQVPATEPIPVYSIAYHYYLRGEQERRDFALWYRWWCAPYEVELVGVKISLPKETPA